MVPRLELPRLCAGLRTSDATFLQLVEGRGVGGWRIVTSGMPHDPERAARKLTAPTSCAVGAGPVCRVVDAHRYRNHRHIDPRAPPVLLQRPVGICA